MTDAVALAEISRRRSGTYWLLSRLVLETPGDAMLRELHSVLDDASIDASALLGAETLALRDAVRIALDEGGDGATLAVEHTRLLAGLSRHQGAPPPFESVFREDRLPGEATIAVSAAYTEAGFEPPVPEAGPADHLGAELRFLALLCHREADAWASADANAAAGWVARERAFLDDHVLQWIPQHCERVLEATDSPYHRAMFTLIGRACLIDRDDVEELGAPAAVSAGPD